MIESLQLTNFTSFNDLKLNLSPKINLIIGENGTGKTQLLKALYFANKSLANQDATAEELLRLYRPISNALKGLVGEDGKSKAELKCTLAQGQEMHINFSANSKHLAKDKFTSTPIVGTPNFVPVKEVLTLMKGMLSRNVNREFLEVLFDQSYLDIAQKLAKKPPVKAVEKIDQDPRFATIYLKLIELLGGRFEVIDYTDSISLAFQAGQYTPLKDSKNLDHYTFRPKRRDSADMTAEGLRKLGTLQLLLQNHELEPGTSGVLLWDEPEANLNPKLMRLVVEMLLEFARNGQQVVIATHDYVLLKWFDLLANKKLDDHIRFHALSRIDGNVAVRSVDDYVELGGTAISNTFSDLYDEEIKRSLGVA